MRVGCDVPASLAFVTVPPISETLDSLYARHTPFVCLDMPDVATTDTGQNCEADRQSANRF